MNRNTAIEGTEETVCAGCRLVPISVLALDLDEPTAGWEAMLAVHGIELTEDDMGRPAISRPDAAALMAEARKWELKSAEENRRRQEEVVRNSRPVPRGIPWPAGADAALTAFETMRGADADAEQSDPNRRLTPQEEFLVQRLGPPRKVATEADR